MIENRNIVCIASNWWYDPTSKHHVMRVLAERNNIVWVNYHGSRRPRFSRADAGALLARIRQVVCKPRVVAENIRVLTPLVAPLPGHRAVAALNRRLLVRQIRAVLRTLPPRPVQLWSFAPDVDYLAGALDEECLVYYCVDEFSHFTGYDRRAILAAEARLAAKAHLVITASKTLYQAKRRLNDETILIDHGVDFDHFAAADGSAAPPDDVSGMPHPILGFWGLIQDWVDVDLLADLAALRPSWSIVLIGEALTDVARLQNLPNVHLLGRRPYRRLPAYARAFDVGLIPFRSNPLTAAVNPIKLKEYLSAGLPVVATPLPELERYASFVHTAATAAEFAAACEKAIADNGPAQVQKRHAAMQSETWPAKVAAISDRIDVLLHRSSSVFVS